MFVPDSLNFETGYFTNKNQTQKGEEAWYETKLMRSKVKEWHDASREHTVPMNTTAAVG